MNKYIEMRKRHQEELEAFPSFFAFSHERFNEGMVSLGLDPKDTDKIICGPAGMYFRKSDKQRLFDMMDGFAADMKNAIAEDKTGDGFIYDMFRFELENHEFGYTEDLSTTLDALKYTLSDIKADKRLLHGMQKALALFNMSIDDC